MRFHALFEEPAPNCIRNPKCGAYDLLRDLVLIQSNERPCCRRFNSSLLAQSFHDRWGFPTCGLPKFKESITKYDTAASPGAQPSALGLASVATPSRSRTAITQPLRRLLDADALRLTDSVSISRGHCFRRICFLRKCTRFLLPENWFNRNVGNSISSLGNSEQETTDKRSE